MKYLTTALALGLSLAAIACNRQAATIDSEPKTIVILGSLTGVGQEIVEEALAPLTAETGIQIVYEGTDAFATILPIRVQGGDPPDIALFPQPGLMADLAREEAMVSLDDWIDRDALSAAYADDWLSLGSVDGKLYGVWMRADPKSLVWYNPKAFAEAGYSLPKTWDELMQLSDQIVADGKTPWCLGMESGDASGWVGTDWVESILLRTAGPAVYDRWVTHAQPFDSPPVKAAFETFGAIVKNPDYVVGGATGAISIPFGDSPALLFDDPPGCYLHRQASFISDFLPSSAIPGETVGVFVLPEIDPAYGEPLLTGGIVFGLLKDSPEARAVMTYLATETPHRSWAQQGYISPHRGVPLTDYPNDLVRQEAEILLNAETIRFDGSDLMPAAVGTGTFWRGMVNYVGGEDVDTVLQKIDQSWP